MKLSRKGSLSDKVRVLQRKKYGCLCKMFCCKWMHCCQENDFSLLTSENRKEAFFAMIKEYVSSIQKEKDVIIDPFFILVGLLMGEKNQQINNFTMEEMTGDIEKQAIFSKEDLQEYIPELCTYLVFHEEMQNLPIFNLLERTARTDLQFSLIYYFYMRSLEVINQNTEFKVVMKYNETFLKKIDHSFLAPTRKPKPLQESIEERLQAYQRGCLTPRSFKLDEPPPWKLYENCLDEKEEKTQPNFGFFQSSRKFYDDLIWLGYQLQKVHDRCELLTTCLRKMNQRLPAEVYLPFRGTQYQQMKVMSIIVEQCKVCSTKQRAPYYICLQMIKSKLPTQTRKLKRVKSINQDYDNVLKRSQLFEQDNTQATHNQREDLQAQIIEKAEKEQNRWFQPIHKLVDRAKGLYVRDQDNLQYSSNSQYRIDTEENSSSNTGYFGESQADMLKRLQRNSPYGNLNGYRLAHFMVKTNDDLRQQSFAMQLLEEFNNIFRMENLALRVITYEVVPLGHNFGLIQFVKSTLTIDELRRRGGTLNFIRKEANKTKNFIKTLAGYSLVTYLLQVKDRHNGNILIRSDGSIIHIDYGYLISNSPGKGVELEKNVAFKMTTEYIEALGGIDSKHFHQFRKLFFKGYQACIKHQHRIMILVKLMYSSHGSTMPCFEKGNQSIQNLEDRLNPSGIRTDGDISLHCQNLINSTIDNWRARWYDKWQYYMQGIFY